MYREDKWNKIHRKSAIDIRHVKCYHEYFINIDNVVKQNCNNIDYVFVNKYEFHVICSPKYLWTTISQYFKSYALPSDYVYVSKRFAGC